MENPDSLSRDCVSEDQVSLVKDVLIASRDVLIMSRNVLIMAYIVLVTADVGKLASTGISVAGRTEHGARVDMRRLYWKLRRVIRRSLRDYGGIGGTSPPESKSGGIAGW